MNGNYNLENTFLQYDFIFFSKMESFTDMLNEKYKMLFLMTSRAGWSRLNIVDVYTNLSQNIYFSLCVLIIFNIKSHDFLQLIQMNHTILFDIIYDAFFES